MKILLPLFFACCIACNNQKTATMQKQIDSLKNEINNSYKPGLGEFMSVIQMHHAKLWFAGTNNNWELADFEINEIREIMDDIEKYCSDRPEIKKLRSSIAPALDSVNIAIGKQDAGLFRQQYLSLTNSCNDCHRSNSFAMNVVTIPTSPPVTNQDFKPLTKERSVNSSTPALGDSVARK